jgi:hypothetical protein
MPTGNTPPAPADTPEGDGPSAVGDTELRDGNGRYTRNPATATRDARAAELRAQGFTYQQIADELGYNAKSAVIAAVRRAVREIVQGPAEKLLALHMERLETLYAEALDVMETDHVVVSHGKVVYGADGRPLLDSGPKLAAIREARASLESFWKLTGIAKPAKVEHSGGVRYEVVGVDPEDLT